MPCKVCRRRAPAQKRPPRTKHWAKTEGIRPMEHRAHTRSCFIMVLIHRRVHKRGRPSARNPYARGARLPLQMHSCVQLALLSTISQDNFTRRSLKHAGGATVRQSGIAEQASSLAKRLDANRISIHVLRLQGFDVPHDVVHGLLRVLRVVLFSHLPHLSP